MRFLTSAIRFIKITLIISVSLWVVIAILCWLLNYEIGTFLIWLGILAIIIGMMSAMGSRNVTGQYNLKYDQAVIRQYMYERNEQNLSDEIKSYDFCLLMAAVGIVSIVVGAIIYKFTGGHP